MQHLNKCTKKNLKKFLKTASNDNEVHKMTGNNKATKQSKNNTHTPLDTITVSIDYLRE